MIPGWIALLVLLATVAGGTYIAYRFGYRDGLKEAEEPICGCGHHRSFHEGVARCRAWARSHGHCECQNYIGPESMPKFLMPYMTKEVDK